jgi:iron complex outermembrane receptor protein
VRPPSYTAYVNLPETTITGFELETIWYPTDNFRMILNYGYTDPEIGNAPPLIHSLDPYALDPAAQPLGPPGDAPVAPDCLGPNCLGQQGQSVEGNSLPFNPKNKIALNGVYTWDLEDGSTLDASVSYFWQDISYTSIFNRSYNKVPSWDQVDGRLTWTSADGNFAIIAWVKNVLDEVQYEIDGFSSSLREGINREVAPGLCNSSASTTASPGAPPPSSCYTTSEQYRPPRTFGAELQIRF